MKVLFFSLEMGPAPLQYFMEIMDTALSEEEREILQENFQIIPMGESMSLNRPEGKTFFEGMLNEFQPNLVFIDSLGTMTTGALNEDGPARDLLEYVQQIRKTYYCGISVVHHANKNNTGPELSLSDFFGNTYLFTGTDYILGLAYENRREDPDILRVTACKPRLGAPSLYTQVVRTKNLTFKLLSGDVSAVRDTSFGGSGSGTGTLFDNL
jgi:hypothetical protein